MPDSPCAARPTAPRRSRKRCSGRATAPTPSSPCIRPPPRWKRPGRTRGDPGCSPTCPTTPTRWRCASICARGELGDVGYVELPKLGATFGRRDVFGTIEAVKAVSELYAPVAGTVTEVNPALEGDPALVNRDPYGAGWMIKLRVKNPGEIDQLLTGEAYQKHIGG